MVRGHRKNGHCSDVVPRLPMKNEGAPVVRRRGRLIHISNSQVNNAFVMAGHSRPKDGVASACLVPASHVFFRRAPRDD
jgi:hypothetical protein